MTWQTLERRFSLHSAESGLLMATYDIAAATVVLAVCYFGERGHKGFRIFPQKANRTMQMVEGRWIGCGSLIVGLASCLTALPHFTLPPTRLEDEDSGAALCRAQKDQVLPPISALSFPFQRLLGT